MKKRKEISAKKCASFRFMPYIKCYVPIQGLEVTDRFVVETLFRLGLGCAPERDVVLVIYLLGTEVFVESSPEF